VIEWRTEPNNPTRLVNLFVYTNSWTICL